MNTAPLRSLVIDISLIDHETEETRIETHHYTLSDDENFLGLAFVTTKDNKSQQIEIIGNTSK